MTHLETTTKTSPDLVCEMNPADKTVLLIDDDMDVIDSLATLLEIETEYTILKASNKEDVERILKTHTPDMALIDIQLGQTSGLDLIPILRKQASDMICTMITAHRDVEYAVKAVHLGANEYLFKPVDPLNLFEHIHTQLCLQHSKRLITKKNKETIRNSQRDTLTGLPGRELLDYFFSKTLSAANRNNTSFAVMFLDLDYFKELNDTLGHRAGDELLINVSKRMQSCLRDEEILARIGGDEFVIVLRDGTNEHDVKKVAERLVKSIASIPLQEGQKRTVTTSIGIAIYPQDGNNTDSLLEYADQAMYRAKRNGKNNFSF